jgi:soluble lytic murein transglycosylase-like protein
MMMPDLSKLPQRLRPYKAAFAAALTAYPVEPELLMALVIQESGGDPLARRYEPKYQAKYVTGNSRWDKARAAGWTDAALATSWGLTQVLGATAWDELGWHYPPDAHGGITNPVSNLKLGAHYLQKQLARWGNELEALLAYNGGSGAVYAYRGGEPYNLSCARSVLALRDRVERGEPV